MEEQKETAVAADNKGSVEPETQKILNDLREENVKKKNKINDLQKQIDEFKTFQEKYAELENKLKAEEDTKLKEKEEFKTLYEKEKAEREKLISDFQNLKKDYEDADSYRKSKKEQEEAEINSIREEIKSMSEDAYDVAVDLKDITKLKKFKETLSTKIEKDTKTHVSPGSVKLGSKGELMTIDTLNADELIKLRESDPEAFKRHIDNIAGKRK